MSCIIIMSDNWLIKFDNHIETIFLINIVLVMVEITDKSHTFNVLFPSNPGGFLVPVKTDYIIMLQPIDNNGKQLMSYSSSGSDQIKGCGNCGRWLDTSCMDADCAYAGVEDANTECHVGYSWKLPKTTLCEKSLHNFDSDNDRKTSQGYIILCINIILFSSRRHVIGTDQAHVYGWRSRAW